MFSFVSQLDLALIFVRYNNSLNIIYCFDKTKENGHPFAYHVYGVAVVTVTLDCIRGTYEVDDVKIVHDFGKSINLTLDRGQVEGAVVQGIGWVTMEELAYDKKGKLLSNSLSTYKIPDIYSAPKNIEIFADFSLKQLYTINNTYL